HLGIPAEEALVVGDMTYDILMAQNAGVATCAVTYGNDTLSNLRSCNPDNIIDHFSDLLEIVK
ncbi:MAG: HAD hydrolase-like protein, partial [Paludibacteraceae bacterium]|nr:HAD hydrolase-like protein [Paludibacteraceae bacterium]